MLGCERPDGKRFLDPLNVGVQLMIYECHIYQATRRFSILRRCINYKLLCTASHEVFLTGDWLS